MTRRTRMPVFESLSPRTARENRRHGRSWRPRVPESSPANQEGIRNWTPCIAPDESYLLFCSTRGLPASDQGDLFVSFRRPDGSWTDPVDLGEPINTDRLERFPAVSPDGEYLFFTRSTPGTDEDVYWVSAGIIDRLSADTFRK